MHAGRQYSLKELLLWTRRDTYGFIVVSTLPTVLYAVFHFPWLALPWVPIALVGTAAAFIVGFRNNATYARVWEARQIYGAIVNTSRTWGMMVRDFVAPCPGLDAAEVAEAHRALVHRHVAWLTALRFQLRQPRAWESMSLPHNAEYRRAHFRVAELDGKLEDELVGLLSEEERGLVLRASNRATRIVALQGQELARLRARGSFDPNAHVALERVLADLYDNQGKCERIKNFPYPRQFATINLYFVRIFTFLVPFGLIGELKKMGDAYVWLTIPLGVLIAWVFNGMERVGQSTENPFEGSSNDVPITSMSRTIEIDLREMLGEENVPPPIPAKDDILM